MHLFQLRILKSKRGTVEYISVARKMAAFMKETQQYRSQRFQNDALTRMKQFKFDLGKDFLSCGPNLIVSQVLNTTLLHRLVTISDTEIVRVRKGYTAADALQYFIAALLS